MRYVVRSRPPLSRLAAAAAVLALASACHEQGAPPPPRKEEEQQQPQPRAAATPWTAAIVRRDTMDCMAPEPDSATAVAAALTALADPDRPLRLSSFVRHHEGMLVSALPADARVLGGGGLVWVDRDGCVVVLNQYE
ncbi:MAG TPA: hypothetical protein VLK84_24755 [Longimicrobium sp.]|nr:hypothetical protein [Longimicrobium sp.]